MLLAYACLQDVTAELSLQPHLARAEQTVSAALAAKLFSWSCSSAESLFPHPASKAPAVSPRQEMERRYLMRLGLISSCS
jgi:hypothetical protein